MSGFSISDIELTVVEHAGQRWLCMADGTVVALPDCHLAPVDHNTAFDAVRGVLDFRARQAEFFGTIRAQRDLEARWDDALGRASISVCGVQNWVGQNNDAWNQRIDAVRVSIRLMIERGSNLKERQPSARGRTWGSVFATAYERSIQWAGRGKWDIYGYNLASNLRKRFRLAPS